jgi:hypothetical protein
VLPDILLEFSKVAPSEEKCNSAHGVNNGLIEAYLYQRTYFNFNGVNQQQTSHKGS